jgi:N-alpha-acetyltransferase 30
MHLVKQLVDPELSEPYSIFTYRIFLTPWPQLCHFCYVSEKPVGVVVCKVDEHKSGRRRGYIGMIVVLQDYRKYGIGTAVYLGWRCPVRLSW